MESRETTQGSPDNADIARFLERIASLLSVQRADPFRVRAWQRAAETCRRHPQPLAELVRRDGRAGLEALPGIGRTIAGQIEAWVATGRSPYLARLEGDTSPELLFRTLPGIGATLADRLHHSLGVETLEELEVAAHDGRLDRMSGIGTRRAQAIRDALSLRLARPRRAPSHDGEPSVDLLLEVDAEYRKLARGGRLKRIAPRRFNPKRSAWLPIWHVDRGDWRLTVLFANTALAHRLDRTRDWVVIYAGRDGEERRYTVVTERTGQRAGSRVVRGREAETPPRRRPVDPPARSNDLHGTST